jgi:CheY-like chemotaxis protein
VSGMERDGLQGRRILVVEDLFHIAEMLAAMLRDFGCEVVGPVPRLAPALRLAESERLDGALLDVNLNGDDAGPVAEALHARGIPFVFVTGYDQSSDLPARFQDAPRLTKPFALDELHRLLLRHVAGAAA